MNDQELIIRYSLSKLENMGIRIPTDWTIYGFDLAILLLKFLFITGDYILPPSTTQSIFYNIASKAIITMPMPSWWDSFNAKQSFLHDPISPDIIEEP